MSYIRSILQPNEQILIVGKLHWIVYIQSILCLGAGAQPTPTLLKNLHHLLCNILNNTVNH